MTVVVGTAGHIDHGKTTLLRALTGIDADRLPEERRRGMTIDVGYAHLTLPDGRSLDFVDVPGHDRLVGNMLVGAGEIDAAMLVVAADDGPRAQTLEHLELLDALGIRFGVAVVTKADLVDGDRVEEVRAAVERLLSSTSLRGSPTLPVSAVDPGWPRSVEQHGHGAPATAGRPGPRRGPGRGLEGLRVALEDLDRRVRARYASRDGGGEAVREDEADARPVRLAIDRAFSVKGRGAVVTGTLRGGSLARGVTLRLVPGDRSVRVREVQVHGEAVEVAGPGRTAVNLAGVDVADLGRGAVVTDDPAVVATDRLLVRLSRGLPDRARGRIHIGTAAADGALGRSGRDAIELPDGSVAGMLRLASPVAAAPGDRFVVRRGSGPERVVGGVVLDVIPARGISRRRQTAERVARLAAALGAIDTGTPPAPADAATAAASARTRTGTDLAAVRLDLHGALAGPGGVAGLAPDVEAAVDAAVIAAVDAAGAGGITLTAARAAAARALRRAATVDRATAAATSAAALEHVAADGRIVRDGPLVRSAAAAPAASAPDPRLVAAMDRLEAALAVAAPPALALAAREAGCPPAGVRELERSARIVVLEPDLAYAMSAYRDLAARALAMAAREPLTPAAFRDATGTSRKYVMAILADLDRRGILRRSPDGHVPGPRAPGRPAVPTTPATHPDR